MDCCKIFLQICMFRCVLATVWNPDAGLVPSLTKSDIVTVKATSRNDLAHLTNDGNQTTHWTSFGCLPNFYIKVPSMNVLLNSCRAGLCTLSNASINKHNLQSMTDGNSSHSFVNIVATSEQSAIKITLPKSTKLKYFTIRGKFNSDVKIYFINSGRVISSLSLNSSDSYRQKLINLASSEKIDEVNISFVQEIMVFEIAALSDRGCEDSVTWDLGKLSRVGVIRSRHWAGHDGLSTKLLSSQDGNNWTLLFDLDPNALSTVTYILESVIITRFIKVSHFYSDKLYAKVYMWELDVYDEHGEYGPTPTAKLNTETLHDMLGVNAIWGWGENEASKYIPKGRGGIIYRDVASHARNYHNMEWDVSDPDNSANYTKMSMGSGTQSKSWLNWDNEYRIWNELGYDVHVSLQFTAKMFPPDVWNKPIASSKRYGREFAQHFGPTYGNGLVRAAEVGNEPWDYNATFYKTILDAMAEGLKDGDENMIVLPGAFQADQKEMHKNYIGTRVTKAAIDNLDVINFHHYSYTWLHNGDRIATHPEDLRSTFRSIHNMIRWRDANAPDKPIWVTEWGWDSPGAGQDCTFSECVTEKAAAVYGVRGLLLHARYGIDRSTWFFYGNLDTCDHQVYCRSGLRGSKQTNFTEKLTYTALKQFLQVVGDSQFIQVIQENQDGYIYEFRDRDLTVSHIIGWLPVNIDSSKGEKKTVTVDNQSPNKSLWCDFYTRSTKQAECNDRVLNQTNKTITFQLTPEPVVLSFTLR